MKFGFHFSNTSKTVTLTFSIDDSSSHSIPSFLSTYSFQEVKTTTTPSTFELKLNNIKEAVTLSDYLKSNKYLLDYNSAMLLYYQTNQLAFNLKQVGLYIPVFDIKDFVVLSDGEKTWFVYAGINMALRIMDEAIIIPLNTTSNTAFFSPEIGVKRLPLKVADPYGCSVYAIALLVKSCLTGDVDSNMEEIYATKLYWAILRSIEERKYLIV
jgi:hypothetical protein